MMEFFNLEAYGHTLQIGYQIYLTRLAKALEKMKLQKTASRNKKIKSSVSYLYDRQRPGVLAKENDGKKLVDLLERLALGHSRWNYRCLSRLLGFNWSNEIGLNRGCLWILNRSNYWRNSAKFCFCWFFACRWAEQVLPDVAEWCKKSQNKSQTIIDACCFKALFKCRFYDFVPLLPSKLGVFQFLWVIKS